MTVQNLKLLIQWNKILKILLKSYRQHFSCQSQRVLRPVFKNTCSLPHQIKAYRKKSKLELLDAEKLIEGRKLKKNWFRENLNKESRKSPLPSKSWVMIICVQYLSGCLKQQIFEPGSQHWTLWTFSFAVWFPIPREERLLDFVLRFECNINWNLLKLSNGSALHRVMEGDANFGQVHEWIFHFLVCDALCLITY